MKIELVFAVVNTWRRNKVFSLGTDPDYVKTNWRTHDLDTLPQWIQERIAVLRLLERDEETELGAWYAPSSSSDADILIAIVRQPGDPKWEIA